ncbi:MAG: cache domain-containing protein, partial [Spirochaetia bacterium]
MLKRISLKARVLILVFIAIALITGFQVRQQVVEFQGSLENANTELFEQLELSFLGSVESELAYLSLAVRTLTENPEISAQFAEQNRAELLDMLEGYNRDLMATYGIAQFQFHVPPATSFLRYHAPQNFGDDLSSFRATVVEANSQQRPVVGLEVGRGGPGMRVVYPVFHDGEHIGSVEFGG